MSAMNTCQDQLFQFLNRGVSPFHAVREAEELLRAHGATYLPETAPWQLQAGKCYYTKRNGSSIIAFTMPSDALTGYRATASHSDAPTWRVKTLSGGDKTYAKAEVEGYGGMIMSTWLDRPLSFAGRVMVKTAPCASGAPARIESMLVHPNKALLCIPNVAIHFNRTLNDGYKYNPQIDLQPMFGAAGESLYDCLVEELALTEGQSIVAHDLVLCPVQEAMPLGLHGDYFMSARIDDLACAYTTLAGFLEGQLCAQHPDFYGDAFAAPHAAPSPKGACKLWVMFDNEEVGSSSRQGAEGSFLPDVLARIESALGMSANEAAAARANSLLLSADNGHAVHPNHPEKSDPEHPVTLGGGVVLKYNANQKYTTNAFTAALFEDICARAAVKTQVFYNRADAPGGSTLGNLLSHQIALPMVDIGLPQLAMHACIETANIHDALCMTRAAGAFYSASFARTDDEVWHVEP